MKLCFGTRWVEHSFNKLWCDTYVFEGGRLPQAGSGSDNPYAKELHCLLFTKCTVDKDFLLSRCATLSDEEGRVSSRRYFIPRILPSSLCKAGLTWRPLVHP